MAEGLDEKIFVVLNPVDESAMGAAARRGGCQFGQGPDATYVLEMFHPRAASLWVTSRTTPWATSSPVFAATRVNACCTYVTMPSGSTPRTWLSHRGATGQVHRGSIATINRQLRRLGVSID
jgi:hypothetical protein